MAGLLALLTALMPFIQTLLVKKKSDAAKWARDGAKAHLAGEKKNTAAAFWLGSLACAFETMSDNEWDAQKTAIPAAARAFQAYAAAQGGAK